MMRIEADTRLCVGSGQCVLAISVCLLWADGEPPSGGLAHLVGLPQQAAAGMVGAALFEGYADDAAAAEPAVIRDLGFGGPAGAAAPSLQGYSGGTLEGMLTTTGGWPTSNV